jgi:nucleoid-associated protein YgaU
MEMMRRVLIPLLILPLVAACAGSAPKSTLKSYDVTQGDYLNEQEYQKLSGDEATEYCRRLAAEIDILRDNTDASNEMMPDLASDIAALQSRLDALAETNGELSGEIAMLEARLQELSTRPSTYTVLPNDWLRKISKRTQVYSAEDQWKRLYSGNRDKIRNPNLIYPGQVLLVPRTEMGTWTVKPGETLRIIAEAVYGSRVEAWRIREANPDKISNPDLIHPGMVLTLP